MEKPKSLKMQLLDEWKWFEELAAILRNAYYAAKYNDWESAIQHLKSGEYTGLSEKLVDRLIEAIRAEAGKEATTCRGYKCRDCKHFSAFHGCNALGEYGRKARGNHPACAFVQPKEEKKKISMKDAILGLVSCTLLLCLNGFDGKKTREYINKIKKDI